MRICPTTATRLEVHRSDPTAHLFGVDFEGSVIPQLFPATVHLRKLFGSSGELFLLTNLLEFAHGMLNCRRFAERTRLGQG